MASAVVIVRDFSRYSNVRLLLDDSDLSIVKKACINNETINTDILKAAENELMLIECDVTDNVELNIGPNLSDDVKNQIHSCVSDFYLNAERPKEPLQHPEMKIVLKHEQPFAFRPRRLSYDEKLKLGKILDDLLDQNIIRESNSPYCSPIVLVKKKTNDLRLCVDYRELNKKLYVIITLFC